MVTCGGYITLSKRRQGLSSPDEPGRGVAETSRYQCPQDTTTPYIVVRVDPVPLFGVVVVPGAKLWGRDRVYAHRPGGGRAVAVAATDAGQVYGLVP
jgi:hypothetical protein